LFRHVTQQEFVGKLNRECKIRTRNLEDTGTNKEMESQQLKQAKLAIVELYQENGELKRQLATKTTKPSVAQSRGGNVAWLKRHLKEAQNIIVHLREVQRLVEENHMEHPGECGPAEQEVYVALASVQGEKA
jgi:predicted RNase H-like nuclease (RuvC/YqgF family)